MCIRSVPVVVINQNQMSIQCLIWKMKNCCADSNVSLFTEHAITRVSQMMTQSTVSRYHVCNFRTYLKPWESLNNAQAHTTNSGLRSV